MPRHFRLAALAILLIGTFGASAQDVARDMLDEPSPQHRAVKVVADGRLQLAGGGLLPLYVSADWSAPLPNITRAIVVVHGVQRNANGYFDSVKRAQAAAGEAGSNSFIVAPQFLTQEDADAFRLPANTLRWNRGRWEGGEPALGPTPTSSFDALDAILTRLADRTLFPHLAVVVIIGHSGGGQVVQRYAIATRGDAALRRAGIAARYVSANPSSYAYFSPDRPVPQIAAGCRRYNEWKYGLASRLPPYLANRSPVELERGYVARQVIYLLGTSDIDPNHAELDKTCMGEAQGPTRYARGHAFADYMRARDRGAPNHVVWDVPGVAHSAGKMFNSPCGISAMFDTPGCAARK